MKLFKINFFAVWAVVLLVAFTACDTTIVEQKSLNQIRNDAFITAVSKHPGYTKLLFLNEDYAVYYRVIKSAPAENKEKRPLQNSRVSLHISGLTPSLSHLSEAEIKALTDFTKVINAGTKFQEKQLVPGTYWLQHRTEQSSLIKGMQIALQNMAIGDVWEIIIPWQLGYGAYTKGEIPAYSTLVFETELVDIVQY